MPAKNYTIPFDQRLMAKRCILLGAFLSLLLCLDCFAAPSFTAGIQTGTIQNGSVNEASGIVASRMNPNVLWTHNDSGDSARIFAMTSAGTNLGTYSIPGASAIDWEDIATGPGPLAGTQYLYMSDIGDNASIRSTIDVYRVPEPVVSDLQSLVNTSISGVAKLTFAYPDGARDAESLFVDPLTKDIYIVTKRETPKRVYRAAYPQATSGTTTLELMTTFTSDTWLTSADISPDGNEILVRSGEIGSGRLFTRPTGGSITDAFNAGSITVPLHAESQGEAIGFDPFGRGYYTTSEGSGQPIYYFDRFPSPAGNSYWDNDGVAAGSYLATGAGIGGSGTWNTTAKWYNGSATVPWLSGNNAVFWGTAGTVTLFNTQIANSVTFKTSGYTLISGALNLTGPMITVDAGVTAAINTGVKGSVGLIKSGGGTLKLGTQTTYSGGTTIADGTLMVLNATGSGTGTGPVAVDAAATLGGTGTIQGDVTNSGVIKPGDAVGTLHMGGAYTQAVAGTLQIDLASASNYDSLAVTGTANLAGTLAVSLTNGFMPQLGNLFEVLTTAGFADTTFATTTLPPLVGDAEWNLTYRANSLALLVTIPGDYDGSGIVDGADYVWWRKLDGTPIAFETWRSHFGQAIPAAAGTIIAANVPEPTMFALASIAPVFVLTRRRNRQPIANQPPYV